MEQGLLTASPRAPEDEYEPRCFGLFKVRKRPPPALEEQPVADIVGRMHTLMRAKRARAAAYEGEEREQRLEALYFATQTPPNTEMARLHARISLSAKKMQVQEMQKYEQLRALVYKIEEAKRNRHDTENFLASSKTLREILDATPNVDEVVDEFRQQMQEQSSVLEESISAAPIVEEAEIDALFARSTAAASSSQTTLARSGRQPCLDGQH